MPADLTSLELEREELLGFVGVHFDELATYLRGHAPSHLLNGNLDRLHSFEKIIRSEVMSAHRVIESAT